MSKAVRSDGTNQKHFEEFMANFDHLSTSDIEETMTHFEESKTNGRKRLDDVTGVELHRAHVKFADRALRVPNSIKKHQFICLQQGRKYWEKGGATSPPQQPEEVMPWQRTK